VEEATTAGPATPAWKPPHDVPPGFPPVPGGPPPGVGGPPPGAGGPPPGVGGPPPPGAPPTGLPSIGQGGPPDFIKDFLKNCPPEPPTVPDFNVTAVREN
jgi:hypothetical protein